MARQVEPEKGICLDVWRGQSVVVRKFKFKFKIRFVAEDKKRFRLQVRSVPEA